MGPLKVYGADGLLYITLILLEGCVQLVMAKDKSVNTWVFQ